MNFERKFNAGITLQTNLREFKTFLDDFGRYIHSFYFSPPCGVKFHTRSKVAAQLLLPQKRALLWDMLELIKERGIYTELLLNTLCLDDDMVKKAADTLGKHGVTPDRICIMEKYYDAAKTCYPTGEYIWSFNNGIRSEAEFQKVRENYGADAFVIGSNFIRRNDLFARLKAAGADVYLLLNNGCSFNCGTCNNTSSTCNETFCRNMKEYSVEYLYALQSIFPQELKYGVIDVDSVMCFKISNRGSSLDFLRRAIDSYVNCRVRDFVKADKNNFALWGRAGYFWKYFRNMDLDRIIDYKQKILGVDLHMD